MIIKDEHLRQAARSYLKAIEGDYKDESTAMQEVDKAKTRLLEVAILWAQQDSLPKTEPPV